MEKLFEELFSRVSISKQKLANDLAMSRSFIQRVISGEKAMSENMYNALMALDYIPEDIKRRFAAEFCSAKYGEEMCGLFSEFLFHADIRAYDVRFVPLKEVVPSGENDIITGIENICNAAYCLTNGSKNVCTNYPFRFLELDSVLYRAEMGEFVHLVYIPEKLNKEAVDTYWQLLHWGLKKTVPYATKRNLFPGTYQFFIIADDRLMLLNDDCTNAVVIDNAAAAENYRTQFMKLVEKSAPAFKIVSDETELLAAPAIGLMQSSHNDSIDTTLCPCYTYDYYALNEISRYDTMTPKLREELMRGLLNYYECAKKINHDLIMTADGLESYANDGDMVIVSERYVNKCEPALRARTFGKLLDGADMPDFKLVKKDAVNLPAGFIFEITDTVLITHLYFENKMENPYEVFMQIPLDLYDGLASFAGSLFEYLAGPVFTMTPLQKKYFLTQMKNKCENME